jgi:hypothetical protein
MHLLRCFVIYAAVYHFTFAAVHIAGSDKTAADTTSRNNMPLFHDLIPQVHQTSLPQTILEIW